MIPCGKRARDQVPGWIRSCIEPQGHITPCEYGSWPRYTLLAGPAHAEPLPPGLTYWTTEYDETTERAIATLARTPMETPIPPGWCEVPGFERGPRGEPRLGTYSRVNRWVLLAPLDLDRMCANTAADLVPDLACEIVVVREIPEGGKWLVSLGIGKGTENLPGPLVQVAGSSRPTRTAFASPEDAAAYGVIECKRRRASEVEVIATCRGNDLTWGEPFPILLEPTVLYPKRGQSARGAYQDYLDAHPKNTKPILEAPCAH